MAISSTVGSYTDYAYTGGMQSMKAPINGVYRLECWGAGGGQSSASESDEHRVGGAGGYSVGYIRLNAGDQIYVCVGQRGASRSDGGNRYNGGRDASTDNNPAISYGCYAGGGCTHMATATGELSSLASQKSAVLIVAGGGGSGRGWWSDSSLYWGIGGNGGGTSGGAGVGQGTTAGAGGTQSSGAGFGYGGAASADKATGGGAGWYGGMAHASGGGGGAGYIGGVPSFSYNGTAYSPATTNGNGSAVLTNGKARITLVAKTELPVRFNGTQLTKLIFNGTEVKSLIYNGQTIFARRCAACLRYLADRFGFRAGTPA